MSFDLNSITTHGSGASFRAPNAQIIPQTNEEVFEVGTQIGLTSPPDSFTRTALEQNPYIKQNNGFEPVYQQYYNATKINNALNSNIQDICDKNGISSQVTTQQIIDIDKNHLETTYNYARMIGNRMGLSPSEKEDLKTGTILHDIGKAYMPSEIINKPGALTDEERSVINSHAELGGEVARQFGANENVVDMIKNHHAKTTDNKLCSILQVADRYSALTQKRAYKAPYSSEKAFKILDEEVEDGKLNGEALNALKQAINSQTDFYNKPLYLTA